MGSGMGLLVICPWTVVIPLFDAGGTRFSGLLVMEYVIPPIVTEVTVKLTTATAGITGAKGPAKRCRETIASGNWDGLGNGQRKSAGSSNHAVARKERLKVAKTGTCRSVQAGRSQTSERDHESVAHATQKGYRVSAATRATCTSKNTGCGESHRVSFGFRCCRVRTLPAAMHSSELL